MRQKILVVWLAGFLLLNTCGCAALLVGGAAGTAGTAAWFSGKLSQEVNVTLDKSFQATRSALRSLDLDITKQTKSPELVQVRSNYTDGRPIWIDIHYVSPTASLIEVRVGIPGDKEPARQVLGKIMKYLGNAYN